MTEGISVTLENVKEVICHVLKELGALERSQMTRPGWHLGHPDNYTFVPISIPKSDLLPSFLL